MNNIKIKLDTYVRRLSTMHLQIPAVEDKKKVSSFSSFLMLGLAILKFAIMALTKAVEITRYNIMATLDH
jgi:hypothetical protein